VSLASVLYPGPTDQGLEEFFYANYQHHIALMAALKETMGVELELFQIYPANPEDLTTWSRQHQFQHDALNSLLGIPGTDISVVDFKKKDEADAWYWQHFLQHQAAAQLCGKPI